MFRMEERYRVHRGILKTHYIRYTPTSSGETYGKFFNEDTRERDPFDDS